MPGGISLLFPVRLCLRKNQHNMKEWIKKNWKTYLLLILSALFGADKVAEYTGTTTEAFTVAAPGQDTPAWTVTGWFYLERAVNVNEPGRPAFSFKVLDNIGKYTVKVPGVKRPTEAQIVRALDSNLAEENGKVIILDITGPKEKGGEEEPGQEEPDTK